ncbi:MAG: DoxX family protein [Bacteroidia bacterium]
MKKIKIAYWIITLFMAAGMIFSSIGNISLAPEAVALFKKMGYPEYIIPFIGWAKILGVLTILIPGTWRLKEWAYAGLTIDICGAIYSFISIGESIKDWWPMLIFLSFILASYYFYIRLHKVNENVALNENPAGK